MCLVKRAWLTILLMAYVVPIIYILLTAGLACLDRWAAWQDVGGTFERKMAPGIVVRDLVGVYGYFVVFPSSPRPEICERKMTSLPTPVTRDRIGRILVRYGLCFQRYGPARHSARLALRLFQP